MTGTEKQTMELTHEQLASVVRVLTGAVKRVYERSRSDVDSPSLSDALRADIAYKLPMRNPREDIQPYDVVYVAGGLVTKTCVEGGQAFVVPPESLPWKFVDASSGRPSVLVTLLGIVPVHVQGVPPSSVGMLLVPSGKGDGCAVFVSRDGASGKPIIGQVLSYDLRLGEAAPLAPSDAEQRNTVLVLVAPQSTSVASDTKDVVVERVTAAMLHSASDLELQVAGLAERVSDHDGRLDGLEHDMRELKLDRVARLEPPPHDAPLLVYVSSAPLGEHTGSVLDLDGERAALHDVLKAAGRAVRLYEGTLVLSWVAFLVSRIIHLRYAGVFSTRDLPSITRGARLLHISAHGSRDGKLVLEAADCGSQVSEL